MKTKRQETILKLIAENRICTQEGLQDKLKEYGFSVTQATVSRDIKSLDLIKNLAPDGTYCYAQKAQDASPRAVKYRAIFAETVVSVDCGQNIVAVKCHTGMGNAACAAIDKMEFEGVVGTLAGDDTVFILMRDAEQASQLVQRIMDMIGR